MLTIWHVIFMREKLLPDIILKLNLKTQFLKAILIFQKKKKMNITIFWVGMCNQISELGTEVPNSENKQQCKRVF